MWAAFCCSAQQCIPQAAALTPCHACTMSCFSSHIGTMHIPAQALLLLLRPRLVLIQSSCRRRPTGKQKQRGLLPRKTRWRSQHHHQSSRCALQHTARSHATSRCTQRRLQDAICQLQLYILASMTRTTEATGWHACRVQSMIAMLCCCCLQDFPPLPEDGRVLQRNEGKWHFTLEESEDG